MPVGFFYDPRGYKRLTMEYGHPLSNPRTGHVLESRKTLYDTIGAGSHPCHWCERILEWGEQDGIYADHLNGDHDDNRPENLVPSCNPCNVRRACVGNPVDWNPDEYPVSHLTTAEVEELHRLFLAGATKLSLAERFEISHVTVRAVLGERFGILPTENRGEDNRNSKLTPDMVREVRTLAAAGHTHRAIGQVFDVSHNTVGRILRGKSWSHVD